MKKIIGLLAIMFLLSLTSCSSKKNIYEVLQLDKINVESISVCREYIIYCPVDENADKMSVIEVAVEDIDSFLANLEKVKLTVGPYAVMNQNDYSEGQYFVKINGERAFDVREDAINVDYCSAVSRGWYDVKDPNTLAFIMAINE